MTRLSIIADIRRNSYRAKMAKDETRAAKRMEQLRDEIRKHDRLYYEEAAPIISDREYDHLYKELIDLALQFRSFTKTADCARRQRGGTETWATTSLKIFERSVRCPSDCAALRRNFWRCAERFTWTNMASKN